MSELSHVDREGRARMVDISKKANTVRTAVAAGALHTTRHAVDLLRADESDCIEILGTARIAGIAAAKRTSDLIPLCHQLALTSVHVEFGFTEHGIDIRATASTAGPTGVEMEALTAVAIAGLTLNYMIKAYDPTPTLTSIRLLDKSGGKSGHWSRSDGDGVAVDVSGSTRIRLLDHGPRRRHK